MYVKISLILFLVINLNAKIDIPLYYPSGVTSNLSKIFYEKVKNFEKQNPNINVKLKPANTFFGVYKEVLANAKNKKSSGVCILEVSELPELVKQNAIIPMDEFSKNNKDIINNILDNFLKNSYFNNHIYALPIYRSTPIVYYNMDMLKTYGITKKDLPTTWNELKEFLIKVKLQIKKEPMLLPPGWFDWLFESFVIQNNGSLSNKENTNVLFNSKEVVEALEFWKDLKVNKLMRKRAGKWKSTINLFIAQKYPIVYYSTGGMGLLNEKAKFNWLAGVMPKNKVYGNAVGACSVYLSQNMSNDEKKASYKLLKYLLSDDVQVALSLKSGYFSVTKSSYKNPKIINRYKIDSYKNAKEQLKYSAGKIMVKNYYDVRKALKKAINNVLDNNANAKKSLDIAQKEAQKYLKE